MICEGCTANEHWRCGMQTWCECDCDGSPDWGAFDPNPKPFEEVKMPEEFLGTNRSINDGFHAEAIEENERPQYGHWKAKGEWQVSIATAVMKTLM